MINFVVQVAFLWRIEVTILKPVSDGLSMFFTKDYSFQRILLWNVWLTALPDSHQIYMQIGISVSMSHQ